MHLLEHIQFFTLQKLILIEITDIQIIKAHENILSIPYRIRIV